MLDEEIGDIDIGEGVVRDNRRSCSFDKEVLTSFSRDVEHLPETERIVTVFVLVIEVTRSVLRNLHLQRIKNKY